MHASCNTGCKLHCSDQGHVEKYLSNEDYVIQIWTTGEDAVIRELIDKDYKVIFSNYDAWYLDCGYAGWVTDGNNWCSPYKGWQAVYDNSPRQMYRELGGDQDKGEMREMLIQSPPRCYCV